MSIVTKRGDLKGRINLGHFHCHWGPLYGLWPILRRARFSQFYPRDLNGRDLPKAAAVIILVAKLATLLNLYGCHTISVVLPNFTKCGQAWGYTVFHIDYNRCHLYCSVAYHISRDCRSSRYTFKTLATNTRLQWWLRSVLTSILYVHLRYSVGAWLS